MGITRELDKESAKLLPYLYKLQIVHANTNLSCPKVHTSSMSALYIYHKIDMLLTCSLISFIQSTLVHSRLMISYYVICHVTTVTCLFIINKKKRNIKLRKIDKRKMLVFKYTITLYMLTLRQTHGCLEQARSSQYGPWSFSI